MITRTPSVTWTLPRHPDAQARIIIESNGRFIELTPSKAEKLVTRLQRALEQAQRAEFQRM